MKTDDDLILEAEERLFTAIKTGDIPALDAELTDDFVHSAIGGARNEKKAFLEGVRTMPYRVLALGGEEQRTRVLGDVALLEGIQRARVELDGGKEVEAQTNFVDVFVRDGDGWKLRHAVELPGSTGDSEGGEG